MILSLTLYSLGVLCYGIKELQSHSKLRWQKSDASFWGELSWQRKWKTKIVGGTKSTVDVEVKERFPLSSTALVFLTDGYHLMQFFYIKLFVLSIILYQPTFTWYWDGAIYLGVWYGVFNLVYSVFQRK